MSGYPRQDIPEQDVQENPEPNPPRTTNHVIWGMTAGILIGTVIGLLVLDNALVGVGIGIVIGAILSTILYRLRV